MIASPPSSAICFASSYASLNMFKVVYISKASFAAPFLMNN